MSCDPNKEAILEQMYEQWYDFYKEEGYLGNQLEMLAQSAAIHQYESGDFYEGDYDAEE